MDNLDNYVPSGWMRDLLHIVGCYYAHQVSSVTGEKWEKDSQAFLNAMRHHKNKEWLNIKELEPLAAVFKEVTGHYLKGLSSYTSWMQASGYNHWRVAKLNQLDCCSNLQGILPPKGHMI